VVRSGRWTGYTGRGITDCDQYRYRRIGPGPQDGHRGTQAYANLVSVHFVSNVDSTDLVETLKLVNPETAWLFLVASRPSPLRKR